MNERQCLITITELLHVIFMHYVGLILSISKMGRVPGARPGLKET